MLETKGLPWQHLITMTTVNVIQNVSPMCKIKVAKFHFIILWRFGLIEEQPRGVVESTPPQHRQG